ncbi:MAG: two-component sensor histidine kinase [Clostridiales bacterium GWB2_37_7]|nr:MAG: two-component sensor histidine kinase [Clostridiales bacterium GWB2_37_7]
MRECQIKQMKIHCQYNRDFHMFHRYVKFLHPLGVVVNLFIIILLFGYFKLEAVGIALAVFFSLTQIVSLFILLRLEKRILRPLERLQKGVEHVAQGNYDIRVEMECCNEVGILTDSFNDMVQKLQENEREKLEYEENRKALIANISHDLKTPITSIGGYVEALLNDVVTDPEKQKNYLKTIHNNMVYINNLIDDLFLFAKLDMQRLQFNFEAIGIKPFMSDLAEEFRIELAESSIVCNYNDKISDECYVSIDGKRIYQAVRNIIGNAVKYGLEQGLKIDIELSKEEDNISIDIKDNGPGISEDKLPHVFDRFYRIDTERTKDLVSTGLGLSIAKELIEANRGKITVDSKPGDGSCFTITLPVIKSREVSQ